MPGSDCRVLVTRPEGQQQALTNALLDAGFDVAHQPLLVLQPEPEPGPAQRDMLLNLDRYRHIIFVSSNAVKYGMAWIEDFWPQLPVGLGWYGPGPGTCRALRSFGVDAVAPPLRHDSEGLLALPQLQQLAGDAVLLVRGVGGRTLIREVLSERGAEVDELACYRRSRPRLTADELYQTLTPQPLVLLSSADGLAALAALLSPAESSTLQKLPLVVPTQRVAEQAQALGCQRVMVADSAEDDAMLQAAIRYRQDAGENKA